MPRDEDPAQGIQSAWRIHFRKKIPVTNVPVQARLKKNARMNSSGVANTGRPFHSVASAPFTEQHILSEVLRDRLQHAGFRVDQRPCMGETIQFLALRHNQIDCCAGQFGLVALYVDNYIDVRQDRFLP